MQMMLCRDRTQAGHWQPEPERPPTSSRRLRWVQPTTDRETRITRMHLIAAVLARSGRRPDPDRVTCCACPQSNACPQSRAGTGLGYHIPHQMCLANWTSIREHTHSIDAKASLSLPTGGGSVSKAGTAPDSSATATALSFFFSCLFLQEMDSQESLGQSRARMDQLNQMLVGPYLIGFGFSHFCELSYLFECSYNFSCIQSNCRKLLMLASKDRINQQNLLAIRMQ